MQDVKENLFHVKLFYPPPKQKQKDNSIKLSPAGRNEQKGTNDEVGQSSDAITLVFTCCWTFASCINRFFIA